VDEVVTMEHVETWPGCKPRNDSHRLTSIQPDNILKRCCFVWEDTALSACSRYDLEIYKMDVNGVSPSTAAILELPNFDGATLWRSHDSFIYITPYNSVNSPLSVFAFKFKVAVGDLGLIWEWD
jgi:hypothetical protein